MVVLAVPMWVEVGGLETEGDSMGGGDGSCAGAV